MTNATSIDSTEIPYNMTRRPDPDKYQDYFFREKAATYSKVFKIVRIQEFCFETPLHFGPLLQGEDIDQKSST